MAPCETCGNPYDKTFQVNVAGVRQEHDSFECAIQDLAPKCDCCGCRIIGQGVEAAGKFYGCAHGAKQEDPTGLRDRS